MGINCKIYPPPIAGVECDDVTIDFDQDKLVEYIYIDVDVSSRMTLRYLIEKYGEPDLVSVIHCWGPSEFSLWTCVSIHYLSMGMDVRVLSDYTLNYEVTPDMPVEYLIYHKPHTQAAFIHSFPQSRWRSFIPWQGFGDYEQYLNLTPTPLQHPPLLAH